MFFMSGPLVSIWGCAAQCAWRVAYKTTSKKGVHFACDCVVPTPVSSHSTTSRHHIGIMKLGLQDPLGLDELLFGGMVEASGLQYDQIKFLVCMLLSLPLAYIHGKFVPAGTTRHIFALGIGMAYSVICFAEDTIHPLMASLICFFLMKFFPRNPFYVLGYSFLHMSAAHMYAYFYEYGQWNIDYTMAHMVLTVKLQITAFAVSDGHDKNRVFNKKWGPELDNDKITPEIFPSLLEFMSYCFYFPSYVAGPCFAYRNYRNWSNGLVEVPAGREAAAAWKFLGSLVILFMNKVLLSYIPIAAIIEPLGTGNPSILEWGIPLRLIYVWWSIMLHRAKYFFVWYMCHSACILSGLAYNGKKKDFKPTDSTAWVLMFEEAVDSEGNLWNGCSNGNYFMVETAQNLKAVTDNWNMGVNYWLKNVFYIRVADNQDKFPKFLRGFDLKTLVTQMTSAFWHGMYLCFSKLSTSPKPCTKPNRILPRFLHLLRLRNSLPLRHAQRALEDPPVVHPLQREVLVRRDYIRLHRHWTQHHWNSVCVPRNLDDTWSMSDFCKQQFTLTFTGVEKPLLHPARYLGDSHWSLVCPPEATTEEEGRVKSSLKICHPCKKPIYFLC